MLKTSASIIYIKQQITGSSLGQVIYIKHYKYGTMCSNLTVFFLYFEHIQLSNLVPIVNFDHVIVE